MKSWCEQTRPDRIRKVVTSTGRRQTRRDCAEIMKPWRQLASLATNYSIRAKKAHPNIQNARCERPVSGCDICPPRPLDVLRTSIAPHLHSSPPPYTHKPPAHGEQGQGQWSSGHHSPSSISLHVPTAGRIRERVHTLVKVFDHRCSPHPPTPPTILPTLIC